MRSIIQSEARNTVQEHNLTRVFNSGWSVDLKWPFSGTACCKEGSINQFVVLVISHGDLYGKNLEVSISFIRRVAEYVSS